MLELILLVGLAALFAAHRKAVARIERLEAELGHGQRLAPIVEAPKPPPVPERPVAPIVSSAPSAGPAPPPSDMLSPRSPAIDEMPPPRLVERETFANLFERFVGGRLLIWIGGIALAVAGVFLVRYSIEIGLITPALRMVAAGLFGLLLIGGGEYARRHPGTESDPRIGQALVGAGILVLYAASYGALVLYALIGLGTATILMGLTTVAALLLSLRHGEPTAAMGLIGGFLTPLLVGDPESGAVPLLAYLGLLNIALYALAQRKGWTWLAAGAALLSFLWTGALLLAPAGDAFAAGVFIIVLSIAASLVRPGEGRLLRLLRPGAIGLVQLSVLVARTDLDLSAWALFGMLAAAGLWLSARAQEYRLLPPTALLLALVLLAGEAIGGSPFTPAVAAGITLLFAGFAFPRAAGDARLLPMLTASVALAGPALLVRVAQEELLATPAWAALLLALAAATASLIWRGRAHASDRNPPDPSLLAAAGCMTALLLLAGYDLVPMTLVPGLWAAFAIGTALAAKRLNDSALTLVAFGIALLAGIRAVPLVAALWEAGLLSLTGDPVLARDLPTAVDGLTVLGVTGALTVLLARLLPPLYPRAGRILFSLGGAFAAGAAYILFKRLFDLSSAEDFVARGFAERLLITQALFLAGGLFARRGQAGVAGLLTALAAARLVWFDLIVHNPALTAQNVGAWPVANLLFPAFVGSAAWLYAARRRTDGVGASGTWLALALIVLIAGAMLLVRQAFQGAILTRPEMPLAEFYGYSLTGLLLAVAIILAGVRLPDKALRAAGLVLLTATILKVFVIDASELEGVLRILSFLGLGVALIGLGKLYATVLNRERASRRE